jgi:ABC-2 type transport system permease protein
VLDVELMRAGFRMHASYRAATFAGLFTNVVFGFLRGAILVAALREAGDIAGYSKADALAYTWLTQGIIAVIAIWGWNDLALRIETGDIATDLTRPIDPQRYWLARDYGRALYALCIRGVVPVLVGVALFDITIPRDALRWVMFATSLALAVTVSFGLRFIVNLTPIWLRDWRGALLLSHFLATLMSGFVMPIAWFPHWARVIMHALPWAATTQAPIDVYLGKATGPGGVGTIAVQILWAVALLLAGRAVLAVGTRKLVVHGG